MSEMSDFLELELLDHSLGTASWTAPTNVYLALHSADPTDAGGGAELAVANGYARIVMSFAAASAGVAAIDTPIVFTASGADWSACTHVGIWDASSAGNLLYHTPLDTARTVLDGGTLTFAATTGVTVTLA